MIVKRAEDYVGLTGQGNKLANAGHAAYWLGCQTSDVFGASTQDRNIIEAFTEIAALLGYRVEKIGQPVEATEAAE